MMVITRRRTRLTGFSVLEIVSWSRRAEGCGDRRSGPQEGPARGAECPTSDAATRAGGACGPVGRSGARWSRFFLFVSPPTQTVAFELDAVSIVNDAVQYGVA
jgi:hypothetical protein